MSSLNLTVTCFDLNKFGCLIFRFSYDTKGFFLSFKNEGDQITCSFYLSVLDFSRETDQ